jgi:hypothetical protein
MIRRWKCGGRGDDEGVRGRYLLIQGAVLGTAKG